MQFNSKDAVKGSQDWYKIWNPTNLAKYKNILFFIAQIIFLKDFAEKG